VRERIRIDGAPLSRAAFAARFYEVYDALRAPEPALRRITAESPAMPMYFRFLTLMAYHVFLREAVDVAIVEVGVGGEYDSTNVVRRPAVCGIAALGIDHTAALGTTMAEIAWHKAGIIKRGVPVFSVEQPEPGLRVIQQRAEERGAPAPVVVAPLPPGTALGIAGDHQRTNAALAVALCREWVQRHGIGAPPPDDDDTWIARGLAAARWPGRTQTFAAAAVPGVVWHVDGAHTAESMAACAAWFAGVAPAHAPRVLLFNAAHGRDAQALLAELAANAGAFAEAVFCPNLARRRADSANFSVAHDEGLAPQNDAARVWAALSPRCKTTVLPTIDDAVAHVEAAYADAAPPVHVLATGSLHLVGGVLDATNGPI
ncbi:Folylpolyglutamate synthetase, partial [Coemansia sp. RSA 2424]